MSEDDYKELMRFHLLFCEQNIDTYDYAAVDSDGHLWVYRELPVIKNQEAWVNEDIILSTQLIQKMDKHELIQKMDKHEDWDKTLIEL